MRQHYWNVIQKVMEHTGVPAEAWYSEWRDVARDKETWKKASERTVEVVRLEATVRCEGAGRRDREPGVESRRPGRNGIGHESVS